MNGKYDPITEACVDYWNELSFYVGAIGFWEVKPWELVSDEVKIVTRLHLFDHVNRPGAITPKMEHEKWAFTKTEVCGYRKVGGQYSPGMKLHPMLMPYRLLPGWFKQVPEIVCDVFSKHTPEIKEYLEKLEL